MARLTIHINAATNAVAIEALCRHARLPAGIGEVGVISLLAMLIMQTNSMVYSKDIVW